MKASVLRGSSKKFRPSSTAKQLVDMWLDFVDDTPPPSHCSVNFVLHQSVVLHSGLNRKICANLFDDPDTRRPDLFIPQKDSTYILLTIQILFYFGHTSGIIVIGVELLCDNNVVCGTKCAHQPFDLCRCASRTNVASCPRMIRFSSKLPPHLGLLCVGLVQLLTATYFTFSYLIAESESEGRYFTFGSRLFVDRLQLCSFVW